MYLTPLLLYIAFSTILPSASLHSSSNHADSTIVQAQIIFRHGLRSPEKPYPGDPYDKEQFWPQGWGSLTNEGKRQQYQLGKFLRHRYNNLITSHYNSSDVHVISSDSDRTIMSALANLAGLFPPNPNETWSDDIPRWQPIPLRTIPRSQDRIIKGSAPCPKYNRLWDQLLRTNKDVLDFNRDHQDLYSYISSFTGETYSYPINLTTFYEALIIQEAHGMSRPNWTNVIYPSELSSNLLAFAFRLVVFDETMKRLKGGPLLTEVLENIHKLTTNDRNRRKLILYSGHDITLVRILGVLDLFDPPHLPEFNSVVMIELHKSAKQGATATETVEQASDSHFVKIYYRRGEGTVQHMHIPGCPHPCYLQAFKNIYTKRLITEAEYVYECNIESGFFDALARLLRWII